jgi:hypothetical protein
MIIALFQTLLLVAAVASYLAISRRVDERLGGGFAFVTWAILVPASFNLQTYSGGSQFAVDAGEESLALFCVAGAVMMLVFTLSAATGNLAPASATRFGDTQ